MNEYNLRLAEQEDMDLLYTWANDQEVRENSFSSDVISYEEHKKWFAELMKDPNSIQYILEYNKTPVGQIRIAVNGERATIGYSVAKEYRHKGYGKKLLSMIRDRVKEDFPEVKYLEGEVKPRNTASQKAFTDAGYTEKCQVFECAV